MSELFDAEKYWGAREKKTYVVTLTSSRGDRDTKYVSARNKVKALHTAKYHSLLRGKIFGTARLATPTDLGATANG